MEKFKIERYYYHPYNPNNKYHRAFYQQLQEELDEDDSELLERLGDISYMFEKAYEELESFEIYEPTTYLVEDNNKFVAFIYLYVKNNVLLIYLGVLKSERGKHYSTNINQDITDYILNNFDIDYIRVCIDEDNIGSIKAVLNAGFVKEENNYYIKANKGRGM